MEENNINIKISKKEYKELIQENAKLKAFIKEICDIDDSSGGIGMSYETYAGLIRKVLNKRRKELLGEELKKPQNN